MTTINKKITHTRKPQYEAERANPIEEMIASIEQMIEYLCPVDEVAEALIDTLRMMNPDVREVVADKEIAIIEIGATIREVRIIGFGYADLYTTLIAAVITTRG